MSEVTQLLARLALVGVDELAEAGSLSFAPLGATAPPAAFVGGVPVVVEALSTADGTAAPARTTNSAPRADGAIYRL